MKYIDGAPVDGDQIWQEVKEAADPAILDVCLQNTQKATRAIQEGGDTLANMTASMKTALIGLAMIVDVEDSEGAKHYRFMRRLAEVCARKQQEALRRVAASN